jgi:hypothetical protein
MVGAVVVTVRVASEPGAIEAGFTEHCGFCAGAGCTEQTRETEPLKPFTAPMSTLAEEFCPGLIGFGAAADADMENSGVKKVAVTA